MDPDLDPDPDSDPDPDPATFVSRRQQNQIFVLKSFSACQKEVTKQYRKNQDFSYYFCLMIEGIRIHISDLWIRIQEAKKHTDPTDPDPQHCYSVNENP
jgi:hypothetical protein